MKYFTIDEFVYSVTAKGRNIDNTPTEEHKKNIEELVDNLLDPLREEWEGYCKFNNLGTPAIRVSSGYRSKKLNSAIGGSNTSAHSIGSAADLVPYNGELKHFKDFCRKYLEMRNKTFDQMISEDEDRYGVPNWIHIGYKNTKGLSRKMFMSMIDGTYVPYTG